MQVMLQKPEISRNFLNIPKIPVIRGYPLVYGVGYVTLATDTTFSFPKVPKVG
jgi:hypothetical protein